MNTMRAGAAALSISSLIGGVCLGSGSPDIRDTGKAAAQNAPSNSSADQCKHYWCSFPPGGLGYVSVAYTEQDGTEGNDDLNGVKLGWGGWFEDPYRLGISRPFPNAVGIHFWLSETKNNAQKLWSAGLGADVSFLALGPVRVFPRIQLGLTYRTDQPDEGWGAVGDLGLGTGILLGHHCQLVLALDRDFDFTAPDSFRGGVEIRWLNEKVQFPIAE